jgi:hypothetical protein
MTMPDRRQAQRTKSDEIIYVDMGPDNGGIVLDISDGGLAFCTAIPIQQADEVEFSLVVKGKGRIEGAGSVAWRNKAGRKCGVKLASSSADAAERLQHILQFKTYPRIKLCPPTKRLNQTRYQFAKTILHFCNRSSLLARLRCRSARNRNPNAARLML